jgi:hypothetical protein
MFAPLARTLMQTLESYSPEEIDLVHRFMVDATAAIDAATAEGTRAEATAAEGAAPAGPAQNGAI